MLFFNFFFYLVFLFFFFFQAEDGIRDIGVTGVQTCALPIYQGKRLDKVMCKIYESQFIITLHAFFYDFQIFRELSFLLSNNY